jgi:transposase
MTFFLGCDVSKHKLDISLIDERGVEQWADTMINEPSAIATRLLTIAGAYPDDKLTCVVEATSILHFNVAETCIVLGIICLVYNPIMTKAAITASVRGKKTDRTDALLIARIGLQGGGRPYVPETYRATKYYARGQQKLGQMSSDLQRYETHLRAALGEVELTQAAQGIMAAVQQQLKAARRQFVADTAANAPVGLMRRLQSIPGIGPFVAASLIGEVQDMQRFSSSKALMAYVGLDPKIRQSGHSLNATGRLSKRGSPYLRRNLFIAANIARQYDPYFKALYDKKRAEGKRYTVANIAVARKLLKVVRSVWLQERDYHSGYVVSEGA